MFTEKPVVSLEFFPTFLSSCKMELLSESEANWLFRATVKSYKRAWAANTTNTWYADKIIELARNVVNRAMKDDRVIIDGISLRCIFTENGIQKVHEYRCPDPNTPEWFLAGAFLVRAQNLIDDQELTNYIEHLEGYFDRLPIKLFDETPRRLRIYGRLSSLDTKGLAELITKVENEKALVLDLSNLEGMGTILYKQFEPLKTIKDLKVLVKADNELVLRHVRGVGFKDGQVIII